MNNEKEVITNTGAWGDLGNGLYRNPVLNADYSDPDIIRVGSDFYLVCSEFHYMGMPVLHSKDLINWTIISRVYDRLDIHPDYDNMQKYGRGSWAPAIRYHNGLFYIYFCTPDEGLYMTTAEKPEGPWAPLHEVKRVSNWEDPCPFWDDDGSAYLGHSRTGAGPIIIHKMSPDGKTLLDDGVIVYCGPTAEGTKFYKRNGYYYLIIPEGGVSKGYQTVLRSRNIYGPYERKIVLETGSTNINGPHQGGLVALENGESWFLHFQRLDALGRVCHLQPVKWVNDWPEMGIDADNNGVGEPVTIYNKPNVGAEYSINAPAASDEFNSPELGLQWAFNHNPVDENWSLTERPGYFRIKALPAKDIMQARNTITQKLMGEKGVVTTELSLENMADGQIAGLAIIKKDGDWIGVENIGGTCFVKSKAASANYIGPAVYGTTIWLRVTLDTIGSTCFWFSIDGENFYNLGKEVKMEFSNWKGSRPALFSYNTKGEGGMADFNWFHYNHDGPCGK